MSEDKLSEASFSEFLTGLMADILAGTVNVDVEVNFFIRSPEDGEHTSPVCAVCPFRDSEADAAETVTDEPAD